MGKWDDDIPLRPAGSVQPFSVAGLLRKLDVKAASEEERASAIAVWLERHTPGPTLIFSLRRSGYGYLLSTQ